MSIWRVILSILFPPFAVYDKGCGSIIIVFLLTICGWVPGVIAALVILNLFFGLIAVLSWAAFGTILRKTFSGEDAGIMINRIMGSLLILVAIWIALPH